MRRFTFFAATLMLLSTACFAATQQTIFSFPQNSDRYRGGLTQDNAGNLYGTAALGGNADAGVVFKLTMSNGIWTESVLHSFDPQSENGRNPVAGVVLDGDGNLYCTTNTRVGLNSNGTVFKLTLLRLGRGPSLSSMRPLDGQFLPMGCSDAKSRTDWPIWRNKN